MIPKPLIISTDPGIDDIAAMTLSLFAPELKVKLLVPTWGNVALKYTLQNTLNLEKFLQTQIPVASGAQCPLLAPLINAAAVHGKTGVAGYTFTPADTRLLKKGLAATLMAQAIEQSPQKVTLLGLGPLTDYALLIRQYPDVLTKIAQIVLMGGSLGRGNQGPLTEYNIAGDPEAAQIVFQSGLPIKVAPLEIGQQTHLTPMQIQNIRASGKVGIMLSALFSHIKESDNTWIKIYDPTAVALLLHPEFFTLKKAAVTIELRGEYTYGASVINFAAATKNAVVATAVDAKAFSRWFINSIRKIDQERAK